MHFAIDLLIFAWCSLLTGGLNSNGRRVANSYESLVLTFSSKLPTTYSSTLYWKSNKAGMFSHLLQTKLVYELSGISNRQLVIGPFASKHYGEGNVISMCNFFDFSESGIQCGAIPESAPCYVTPLKVVSSEVKDVCYNDTHLVNLLRDRRQFGIVSALWIKMPFKILASRLEMYEDILKDLLENETKFTVAHWRRGDQIELRCNKKQDVSVNCGNASDFIAKVRKYSQDKIVYVATNEPQDSKEMDVIRKAGFKTVSNVVSSSSSGSGRGDAAGAVARQQRYNSLDALSLLAVEYSLMVRADTYLAWGISEIDDVVEYERMKMGKTHCTAHESGSPGRTYCNLRNSKLYAPK